MTFIGIVIFTIYTTHTVYVGTCDPAWSSETVCADVAQAKQEEESREEARYVGEFASIEACDTALRKVTYTPKAGERVGDVTELLCVPKDTKP